MALNSENSHVGGKRIIGMGRVICITVCHLLTCKTFVDHKHKDIVSVVDCRLSSVQSLASYSSRYFEHYVEILLGQNLYVILHTYK